MIRFIHVTTSQRNAKLRKQHAGTAGRKKAAKNLPI